MKNIDQYIYGKYEGQWVIAKRRPDKGKFTYEILTSDVDKCDMWRSLAFLYKEHADYLENHIKKTESFISRNFCYTHFEPEGIKIKEKTIFYFDVNEDKPFFPGSDEPFTWINGTPTEIDEFKEKHVRSK